MISEPQTLLSEYNQALEKKQRNLVKRKAKLDQYKSNLAKGATLNDDQKKAVSKYDEVVNSIALFSEIIETTTEFTKKLEKALVSMESQQVNKIKSSLINGISDYVLLDAFLRKINLPPVKEAVILESSEEKYQLLSFMKSVFVNTFNSRVDFNARHKNLVKQSNLAAFRRHVSGFLQASSDHISFPKNIKLAPVSYSEALEFAYSMMNNERCQAVIEGKVYTAPEPLVPASPSHTESLSSNTQETQESGVGQRTNSVVGSASFNFLHDSNLKKEEKAAAPVYKSEFLPVNTFLEKTEHTTTVQQLQQPELETPISNGIHMPTRNQSARQPNLHNNHSKSDSLHQINGRSVSNFSQNQMEPSNGQYKPRYPVSNGFNSNPPLRGNCNNGGGRSYRRNEYGDGRPHGGHQNQQAPLNFRSQMRQTTRIDTS